MTTDWSIRKLLCSWCWPRYTDLHFQCRWTWMKNCYACIILDNLSISPSRLAPPSPIWLSHSCSVISVWDHDGVGRSICRHSKSLTWFTLHPSIRCHVPSSLILFWTRNREVSVCNHDRAQKWINKVTLDISLCSPSTLHQVALRLHRRSRSI